MVDWRGSVLDEGQFEWISGQKHNVCKLGLSQPDDRSSDVQQMLIIYNFFGTEYQPFAWHDLRCDWVRSAICAKVKTCLYNGYVYAWELDLCLKFYFASTERLSWSRSRKRCQNEAGDLIVVDSEFKEKLFLIYLNEIRSKAEKFLINIPVIDFSPVQGVIGKIKTTLGLIECACICDSEDFCEAIYYNQSSRRCTTIHYQTDNYSLQKELSGIYYRTKEVKTCLYSGYKYAWELDLCLKFYFAPTERLSWSQSRTRCQNESGDLIVVDSESKDKQFLVYLNEIHNMTSVQRWWIGGSDVWNEGQFEWISGQNITYTNWGPGQPDDASNDGTTNADCIQYFFRQVDQSFAWLDLRCNSNISSSCESKAFI
ncbi:CD206 [Mytilus edulis]|uniref:MRC n=1 Tax=Mytilus edulis TaxID=6550 RepID=A0A8S3S3B4_MYTED|nr:CD206 [Mytilus edulis]